MFFDICRYKGSLKVTLVFIFSPNRRAGNLIGPNDLITDCLYFRAFICSNIVFQLLKGLSINNLSMILAFSEPPSHC